MKIPKNSFWSDIDVRPIYKPNTINNGKISRLKHKKQLASWNVNNAPYKVAICHIDANRVHMFIRQICPWISQFDAEHIKRNHLSVCVQGKDEEREIKWNIWLFGILYKLLLANEKTMFKMNVFVIDELPDMKVDMRNKHAHCSLFHQNAFIVVEQSFVCVIMQRLSHGCCCCCYCGCVDCCCCFSPKFVRKEYNKCFWYSWMKMKAKRKKIILLRINETELVHCSYSQLVDMVVEIHIYYGLDLITPKHEHRIQST